MNFLLFVFLAAIASAAPADLFTPVKHNDLTAIRKAVRSGADVNARDESGATALMYAAVYSTPESMRLLIKRGAEVNAKNKANATSLMWAIGDMEKVRLLLQHGADVNARSDAGKTPLLLAMRLMGGTPVAQLLIAKGADLKAADNAGATALLFAAGTAKPEMVRVLLAAGLDVSGRRAPDPGDKSAAASPQSKFTALMAASDMGNPEVVRLLLDAGPDVNAKTAEGVTALGIAAFAGDAEIARLLLDRGADPNCKGQHSFTPLMLAAGANKQNPEVIRMLLAKGADQTAKDEYGDTAADWARKQGDTEIARLLGDGPIRPAAITPVASGNLQPVRDAVQRAIRVLQPPGPAFFKKTGCISCHHQSIGQMAVSRVRPHGIVVDESIAQLQTKSVVAAWTPVKENLLQNYCQVGGFVANVSYGLIGLADEKYQPTELTDAVAHCLSAEQEPDGSWNITDIRPPLGNSRIKWTALGLRALQLYAPAGSRAAYRVKIERAKKFLLAAKANGTQDLVFQILGLKWAGASDAVIRQLAKRLGSEQRPDGGWAQMATMQPDAYATGQAMFALREGAGWNATDAVYQRGVEYLRRTQLADGSWHVRTRAFAFQKYFETGFPHGRDQFISSAATGWAVIALAPVIEELPKMANVN